MRETFITLLFSEIDRVAVDLNEKRIIVHGPSGKSLPRNHRFHKAMGVGGAVACCCTQLDSRHTESSINFPLPVPYPSTGTPAYHLFSNSASIFSRVEKSQLLPSFRSSLSYEIWLFEK